MNQLIFLDVSNLGSPLGWRVEECIATLLSHSNWPNKSQKERMIGYTALMTDMEDDQ